MFAAQERKALGNARRIVVKFGSRVLVTETGKPDLRQISNLVMQVAELKRMGKEVILLSSGAIAAGIEALGLSIRPTNLPQLQMAAAVGQVRLMTAYDRLFSAEQYKIGQLLLTHDDLKNRTRHLNARNTMVTLLEQGIIPVINENDVVAVDEIRFGDNDVLAALVSILIEADALLLISTTDGLKRSIEGKDRVRIPFLPEVTDEVLELVSDKSNEFSLGGMASKLKSAQIAADVGVRVVIADGRQQNVIPKIILGEDIGTLISGEDQKGLSRINRRKRWIAFFHRTSGAVVVDDGACSAIVDRSVSLLPIGVVSVEGNFPKGALVNIKTKDGTVIAKGLVDFSSEQIQQIKGKKTSEIESILGFNDYNEIIHRENMVVMSNKIGVDT
jgi:glutamate 5-kinase